MPDLPNLAERSAFAGRIRRVGPDPAGIRVAERPELGLATLLARRETGPELGELVLARYGIALPQGPFRVRAQGTAFMGIGPGAWLVAMDGGSALIADLAATLVGCACVSDQSDGLGVLRVEGPRIRETLAKGLPIDLHSVSFGRDSVAVTIAAHIGLTIWSVDGRSDAEPAYEIAVSRSLAGAFYRWLEDSGAEYGLSHD